MKIVIAIDPWKLDVFKKHLDAAGLSYEVNVGSTLTVIKVEGEPEKIRPIVEAANQEARRKLGH